MVENTKINCKLTNVQLSKLKKAIKNNDGTILRIGIRNFNKNDLPHKLLLTTRQNTKLRNAINNKRLKIKQSTNKKDNPIRRIFRKIVK